MPWYFYNREMRLVPDVAFVGVPTGAVIFSPIPYTAPPATIPVGYLFCNGQLVSKTTYNDLYLIIGSLFGETLTDFYLPDYRGRFMRGTTSSLVVGDAGGSKSHTHSINGHSHVVSTTHNHTYAHTHDLSDHTHAIENHDHGAGGLQTAATGQTLIVDTYQPEFGEPNLHHVNAPVEVHGHSINGTTGGIVAPNPSSSSSGSGSTGASSDGTLTDVLLSGSSSTNGGNTSASYNQFPPFFTGSFLIKV